MNQKGRVIYIADHSFTDDKGNGSYEDAGIFAAESNGYISAFCYSEKYDWLFVPGEVKGDSALPVGDYFWINAVGGWMVAHLGGTWSAGAYDGAFCLGLGDASSYRSRYVGGRLLYTPDVDLAEEAA